MASADQVSDELRVPQNAPSSSSSSSTSPYPVSSFTYTPFYCEENVYFLCKKLISIGVADTVGVDIFVVFISNEEKKVPLWHQKASNSIDGLVVWDYHVICFQSKQKQGNDIDLVWDLDTTLPFPSLLNQYIPEAIRPLSFGHSMYSRLFRVVHAPIFLRSFASDRSHMKDSSGNWISSPPVYDPIVAEDGTTNNLNDYIQMRLKDAASLEDSVNDVYSSKYGVVLSETMLEEFFSLIRQRRISPKTT